MYTHSVCIVQRYEPQSGRLVNFICNEDDNDDENYDGDDIGKIIIQITIITISIISIGNIIVVVLYYDDDDDYY